MMKSHLLFSAFIVAFLAGNAQDTINKTFYPGGQLRGYQLIRDSATVFEKVVYEDGKTWGEGTLKYINGKFRPVDFKSYYEDGSIKVLVCDTSTTVYDTDGTVSSHYQTKNGLKEGAYVSYLDGKLFLTATYKNDQKDGLLTAYKIDSGKKAYEESYKGDNLYGPTTHYNERGQIVKKVFYEKNCPVKVVYYNKLGKATRTLIGKKEIWLKEGKPLNCR